ncbi:MAG: autotransporter domain-containing protein [Endomicrobia bacterium]|nr:autotransporter domain-containing protein [Endomicrobiia bacterium]
MKRIKLFIFAFFIFMPIAAYCQQIDFINQNVVNSSWTASFSTGVFHGGYTISISTEKTVSSGNLTLKSNDDSMRTLYSSGTHRFLSFNSNNSSVNASSITFYGGRYDGDTGGGGGGAIYINATNFTISGNNAIFSLNQSNTSGGAVYLAYGTLTLDGHIIFNYNRAITGLGGAVFSGGNIVSLAGSYIEINSSTASYGGGAFYTGNGYIAINGKADINANRVITDSTGTYGGAFYASDYILFGSNEAVINITANSGQVFGGALYSGSSITFNGGAKIESNSTTAGSSTNTVRDGGAIYARGNVIFSSSSATIEITKNSATGNGGAIYSQASVTFAGSAFITNNSTQTSGPASDGGAVWAQNKITFSNISSTAAISYNTAKSGNGGALFSNSYVQFDGYVTAVGNKAEKGYGGFLVSSGVIVRDGGEFAYNTAYSSGGAFYIANSTASSVSAITRDVVFKDNMMYVQDNNFNSGTRNDIYMAGNSTITFNAASGRSITLNGGITTGGNNNFVVKTGSGTLALNGSFSLQTFYVNGGTVTFGDTSTFTAVNAVFSAGTIIDLRNNVIKNELIISSNITSSALIYYDFDSDSSSSDLIDAYSANMQGTTIKVGVMGIYSSTRTYTIITSTNGSGAISVNKTNSQGNDMRRVSAGIAYQGGSNSPSSWNNVNLSVFINQLNAIKGLTGNQLQVALALDDDYGNAIDDLFYIIDTIDALPNDAAKKDALNDISGHIYANAVTLPALNASKNNILSRLKKSYFIADDSMIKRNVWIQGYGSLNLYNGDKDSPGDFKASNSGLLAGFDTLRDERYIFGVSAGYVGTNAKQNNDNIDIDGYSIGGYGAYFFENNFEAKFMVVGGRQNYASSREIRYLNRTTKASFVGYSLNVSAEGGYDYYYKNNIYFKPFAGFDYSFVATNEFSETGVNFSTSAADLTVYAGSYNRFNTGLGLQINNGTQMRLKWYGEVKMDLLLLGRTGEFDGKFKYADHEIEIKGITNDVMNFAMGVGALYDISSSFSAYANASCSLSGTQTGYYGNIGLNYKFSTEIIGFYDR